MPDTVTKPVPPEASHRAPLWLTVAMDATGHSRLVSENLHRFIKPKDSLLDLLYVLPHQTNPDKHYKALESEVTQAVVKGVDHEFEIYSQILTQHGFTTGEQCYVHDAPSVTDGILKHMAGVDCDFLVMGMHDLHPQGHRLISSTAYEVATHAACPVLVIKQAVDPKSKLKVLLAVDASTCSQTACQKLSQHLPTDNTEIQLLTVTSVSAYNIPLIEPFVDYGQLEKALKGAAVEQLEKVAHILREAGYSVTSEQVALGDPAHEILDLAERDKIDLIVTGAHSSAVSRWLLGSVSARVLEYSPCSVAILR